MDPLDPHCHEQGLTSPGVTPTSRYTQKFGGRTKKKSGGGEVKSEIVRRGIRIWGVQGDGTVTLLTVLRQHHSVKL